MKEINITVIGIGKLGLCISLILEKHGYNVLGIDIDDSYVNRLNDKKLNFSKVKSVSLKAKNNKSKTGIKLKKRLTKFFLIEGIYCSSSIGLEVITFVKYN